ncbi:LysR family transcriptional regulator [Paracoccus sp. YIM 132242]|uniref:LysR family transcriptional regulator n=1 Tax=Paracoccus lichenicola TaxID=2665644 RepID=A0A6L6HUD9_9RHOB|nr:LysR family transcriptional regulator [Paracoccus lichenicola]MTE01930.1 LysR family transcriptional regulator [Paracoccus lichenicola]
MSEPVSWDDQHAFLLVFEHGSLSAAARALGQAQPTVRARIEALERKLGTVLFTRSSQGLLPTKAARALHVHARAMAHASEAFVRAASSSEGAVSGTVRIAVSEFMGQEVLPPMLARLRLRHPGLALEVAASNAPTDLTRQEADLALRTYRPGGEALVGRKLGEVALGLFAHRDYLAARGVPGELADLAAHDLIGPDRSASDRRLAEAALPAPALARFVLRTDSHPGQLAAARAGLGIAVVQRPVGLADPDLRPVLPDLVLARLPLWLVAHRDLLAVPRVRACFDHLAREVAGYGRE